MDRNSQAAQCELQQHGVNAMACKPAARPLLLTHALARDNRAEILMPLIDESMTRVPLSTWAPSGTPVPTLGGWSGME